MNVMCNYRVWVSNVINDNMVSVYFCDYGDVSVMPLEKLQPLTDQFKQLPYQAIKAKLAGKCRANEEVRP
jgi:tudor domain-containing protein 1/4/6/7